MRITFTLSPTQELLLRDVASMLGLGSVSAAAKYLMTQGIQPVQPALSSYRSGIASTNAANALPEVMKAAMAAMEGAEMAKPGPSRTRLKVSQVTPPRSRVGA